MKNKSINSDNKTVLITGANRGIGLALTQYYAKQDYNVIATCRKQSEALLALDVMIIDGVDVTTDNGMAHLKKAVADRAIDLLINNAGILRSESLDNLDYTQMTEQFMVNTLGPIRVVEALLDNLSSDSKIAFITSRMGSIEDNTSGSYYGYRMSKCALNIAAKSMAIDLKPRQIAVGLLHPGFVQTEMVNFSGEISAELSASRLAQRIAQLNLQNSGSFWHSHGERLPW